MKQRTGIPCDVCGDPTWVPPSSGRSQARHKTCFVCGTRGAYHYGCRCTECAAWKLNDGRNQHARRKELDPKRSRCIEPGCDRAYRTREMCKMHYKRWARQNGMERQPSNAWSERRSSNRHARRARLQGGRNSDQVILTEVIARDGLACQWCQEPVDLAIAWPDRMSKSLDHVTPLSRGGEHTLSNAALMHLGCNSSKGSRTTFEHTHGEGPLEVPR